MSSLYRYVFSLSSKRARGLRQNSDELSSLHAIHFFFPLEGKQSPLEGNHRILGNSFRRWIHTSPYRGRRWLQGELQEVLLPCGVSYRRCGSLALTAGVGAIADPSFSHTLASAALESRRFLSPPCNHPIPSHHYLSPDYCSCLLSGLLHLSHCITHPTHIKILQWLSAHSEESRALMTASSLLFPWISSSSALPFLHLAPLTLSTPEHYAHASSLGLSTCQFFSLDYVSPGNLPASLPHSFMSIQISPPCLKLQLLHNLYLLSLSYFAQLIPLTNIFVCLFILFIVYNPHTHTLF